MPTIPILFLFTFVAIVFLQLQKVENLILTPASSPEGKQTRAMAFVLFLVLQLVFVVSMIRDGLRDQAILLLYIEAALFGVLLFVYKFRRKQ